ncbi:MAG: hypothetical protein ACTHKE_09300 [Sphingomicrobium sp.]
MNEALWALTEAVRLSRLEIECFDDPRCRATEAWTIQRLRELLCNQDIDAAMALIAADEASPSIVPQHSDERHHA